MQPFLVHLSNSQEYVGREGPEQFDTLRLHLNWSPPKGLSNYSWSQVRLNLDSPEASSPHSTVPTIKGEALIRKILLCFVYHVEETGQRILFPNPQRLHFQIFALLAPTSGSDEFQVWLSIFVPLKVTILDKSQMPGCQIKLIWPATGEKGLRRSGGQGGFGINVTTDPSLLIMKHRNNGTRVKLVSAIKVHFFSGSRWVSYDGVCGRSKKILPDLYPWEVV